MVTEKKGQPVSADASKCTGCLVCELRCSLRFEKEFVPAQAAIEIRRQVGQANEYTVSFSDKCDYCGICVRYCAYGTLSQEKKGRVA